MTQTRPVLRRSRHNRVLAGVCGGLADFFGISAFWFRLAFVIALIPGGGTYAMEAVARQFAAEGVAAVLAAWSADDIGRSAREIGAAGARAVSGSGTYAQRGVTCRTKSARFFFVS